MAKLPDWTDLGAVPRVSGDRAIGGYDVSSLAKGEQDFAKAGANFGKGIGEVGTAVAEVGIEKNRWDYHVAHADALTKRIDLNGELQKDTDYATMGDRYQKKVADITSEAASRIGDPRMRERFVVDQQSADAQFKNNVDAHARKLEGEENVAWVKQRGDAIINKAIAADDETRGKLVDAHGALIDGLAGRGFVSPAQAYEMKRQWAHQYAIANYLARADQDPQGVINELRAKPGSPDAVVNRILQNEGTGANPRSSATGAGQFIDSTWLDVLKRNRPELAEGRSDEELLALRADKNLGREMTGHYARENAEGLKRQGLEATPGNVYLSHVLGPKGAAAVLQADPGQPVEAALAKAVGPDMARKMVEANPSILQGKLAGSVRKWADGKMGGADPGQGIHEVLRPDDREQILARAQQSLDRQQTQDLSGFKQRVADTTAEAMRTGTATKPVTLQEFVAAHGAEHGPKLYREYQADLQLGRDVQLVGNMSYEDQDKLLASREPQPGEGYAGGAKRQRALEQTIQSVRQSRFKDPVFRQRVDDTIAEASRTGKVDNPATAEDFIAQFGANEGPQAFKRYSDALRAATDLKAVGKMSYEDQDELLARREPVPGADYATGAKRQRDLEQEVARVRQARIKDPAFQARIADTTAEALANGEAKNPITADEFSAQLGPDLGPRAHAHYTATMRLGRDIKSVADLSPQEEAALLKGYEPKAGEEDFGDKAKRYAQIAKAIEQVNKERSADPAQYVITRTPAGGQAWQEFSATVSDPSVPIETKRAAATALANTMEIEQQRLGIAPQDRRIVPKGYVEKLQAALSNPQAEGGTQGVFQRIDAEARLWGDRWPDVYKDVAKDAEPVVRVIGAGVTPMAGQLLAELKPLSAQTILKDSSADKWSLVQDAVRDVLKPYAKTLTGREGSSQQLHDFEGQMQKLTAYWVSQGDSETAAAEKAFKNVLGHKYEFRGTFAIPKYQPNGQPTGYDGLKIERGAGEALDRLEELGAKLPNLVGPAAANTIKRDGTWVTAPGEKGLALVWKDSFVRKTDGTPLVVPFEELERLGTGSTASLRRALRNDQTVVP